MSMPANVLFYILF